jgi:protocatechuate 3,4-dioxygenase, alpha subunit
VIFGTTPSQTVGPYFAIGLPWPEGPHAVAPDTPGTIAIAGSVYDGAGVPVPDFLLETWQADSEGRFNDLYGHGGPSQVPGFRGFARYGVETGDGSFEILTVKPGRLKAGGGVGGVAALMAPHIAVTIMARGMLNRCVTRIYFGDEPDANGEDPILSLVPAERRETLIAAPDGDSRYRFDIRLQGAGETVFFAI